jgi:hypothetical protein
VTTLPLKHAWEPEGSPPRPRRDALVPREAAEENHAKEPACS